MSADSHRKTADLFFPAMTVESEPLAITQEEAAKLTRLSAKTLERLALAGEPVGRMKVGRRVLYHVSTLNAWLVARLAIPTASNT